MKKTAHFNATGVTFGRRQGYLVNLSKHPDARVFLRREKSNSHDANAIRIVADCGNKKFDVGYVPKSVAATLAPVMDRGIFVIIDGFQVVGGQGLTYGIKLQTHWYERMPVAAPVAAPVPAIAMA